MLHTEEYYRDGISYLLVTEQDDARFVARWICPVCNTSGTRKRYSTLHQAINGEKSSLSSHHFSRHRRTLI